jgi:AcrR family transcriptional regulator
LSDTRGKVLDATLECLVRNGYSGTTARAIGQTGGFAPGVIYYHFADLDAVLMAAVQRSSQDRATRYTEELAGLDRAREVVDVLRRLYDEDVAVGHVAAVQEIYAGARPGSPLAALLAAETARWEELGGEVLTRLLRRKPLGSLVRVPTLASAAVAFYLGMETLTHLDGDRSRPEKLFDQASRLAAVFDRIPRLRRAGEKPATGTKNRSGRRQ